ncbi:hybrid sensor histidine kinase/response regulator [Okeania sp. SIO1I7]|uniref:hybrid sensor histidine kinase/response regulator n=1 Tax=Okeania sp. SIO1I7 TaxID=2607772 RepID=UPI0013FA9FBE|nr:hybrid sensor histidine kinase/response regulator [Okeania sp. SIO1I7]NET29491.1 hybrid sensor histidine kinase/response regulator [Okeania sp. SIO1I7]
MIEIDDQAYEFFVEEATELLQTLEGGLINISQEHEIQKLHQLMRAAHSIKGGAACIGLMGIQKIAHNLENSIRALYQENTVFDLELENLLLQAFDCLRSPTLKQIETGNYNQENSMIKAQQVFEQIEKKLGHSLEEAAEFPEVSMEEGDMTKFLFTEEIPSGLHRWQNLLAGKNGSGSGLSIKDELKRQAEVFATLGTMLNLPGFTSIAKTTIKALEVNPKYIKKIGTLALADFWAGQKAVLAGDRTQGGNPNPTLVKLAKPLTSRKVETTAKRKQVNQPTQPVKAVVPKKSEVATETENVKTPNSATASVNISQKQASAPGVTNKKKQIQQNKITSTSPSSSSLGVRIDINRLEMLNNLLGELATQDNSFILQNEQAQAAIGTLEKGWQNFHQLMMKLQDMNTFSEQLNKSPNSHNNKLAYLVNILPNLLEEIAQVGEAVNDIKLLHQQSQQVVKKRQQTLQQIQNNLTKTRMLPVESLLNRFPRMIRDLSVQKQKQVKLELVGMKTLIDKAVLEKLYDPIVHIVRNAFDHGIETPEIRQNHGKPKEGTITIKSYYQGNYTYLAVEDDGQGIDVKKIRNQAIEKKIFSATEAAKLSTKKLYKLLFYPDFSTTKKVSDLSGRGMGLESVYRQIESLKGNITIQSKLGKGTKFILRLPWTLTITKLLVFRMEGNLFAIPLDILAGIIYVEPSEIQVNQGEKIYYWKGKKVPIAPSILFDCNYPIISGTIQQEPVESSWKNSYTKNSQGKVMLLLISEDSDTIAIKIDRILMEQNLTIKPFSKILTAPSYLYGCAILGDGSLVPVIDGIQLLEKILHTEQLDSKNLPKNTSKFKQSTISKLPTILVIDDSLTTRQAISNTLQKAGYDIVQAKDGWQGLVQLQQQTQIQAIICDVEMPQMNGFEFLSRCRKQYSMAEMPVLMLTSRSSQPYRILAKQLGANDYLTKPYLDQELINSLQSCLQV